MADISKIKVLDGTTYDIKDSVARELLDGHTIGISVPSNAIFTDTWIANSSTAAGYVAAATGQSNKVWMTNENGEPAWRETGVSFNLDSNKLLSISSSSLTVSSHYINDTKVAINSTSEPTENFYVNGTIRFAIGSNDTASDKRFIIGDSGRRYLSLSAAGFQAYDSSDASSVLYLNYNGGTLQIGKTTTITCDTTIYGSITSVNAGGTGTGFFLKRNSSAQYGRLYINTVGTTSATGIAAFALGNSTATENDNNAQGLIYLYSSSSSYHALRGAANTTARNHYFPNSTGWVATGGNGTSTGVGSTTQPVYLDTNGVLTATTYSLEASVPSNAVFTDTTYSLSISSNRITLTPSTGSATYVDLPVYNGGVS